MISYQKLYVIESIEAIKSELDLETELNNIEVMKLNIESPFNNKRQKVLDELNELEKAKFDEINNNTYEHFYLYYYDFKIYSLLINNKTCFDILKKYSYSEDKIFYTEEISLSEYLILHDHNMLKWLNVKWIKPLSKFSLPFIPRDVEGLNLHRLKLNDDDIQILDEFANLKYLNLSYNNITNYNIKNNSIRHLNLQNNNSLRDIELYNNLEHINILNTRIGKQILPFKFLKSITCSKLLKYKTHYLTNLEIVSYRITTTSNISKALKHLKIVSDNPIYDDNESLHYLKINSKTLPYIECPNLINLEIVATNIDMDNLKECMDLRFLSLYVNNFINLHLVNNFNNLIKLRLSNVTEEIKLNNLKNLQELELSVNKEYIYSEDMFLKLKKLTLYGGILKYDIFGLEELNITDVLIKPNILRNLSDLRILTLRHVFINNMFFGLYNLRSLTLCCCKIEKITKEMFSDLCLLEELNISGRRIDTLEEFDNLIYLKSLTLKIDYPIIFPTNLFLKLVSLRRLDIILFKNEFNFNGLKYLTCLKIEFSDYINIDDIFMNHVNIEELTLNMCSITVNTLKHFNKLRKLKIPNYKLNYSMFKNLNTLEHVTLRGSMLDEEMIELILKKNKNLRCLKHKFFGHEEDYINRKYKYFNL